MLLAGPAFPTDLPGGNVYERDWPMQAQDLLMPAGIDGSGGPPGANSAVAPSHSAAFWRSVLGARKADSNLRALVVDTLTLWWLGFSGHLNTTGAQALWHEARVSVAAEVALQTSSLRTCLQQSTVAERDAQSRAETARLSALSERAGFTAPATAALARASAAEGAARASQQRMQCEVELKTLVALTGWEEPRLRVRLAAEPGAPAPDALFVIAALPAQVLAQRPDVYNAEREVAAASAEVGSARAQRYPRLSLSGSVGLAQVRTGGVSTDFTAWTIGPLALSVPIFDGGRRAAQTDAAQARYDEAASQYRAKVRQAVSEVEQALVRLQSTAERSASARTAAEGYRASFDATEARWRGGLASLVELEDARRTALAAENALVALQHERQAAWIALYRAAGGGWKE